jgi:hypothetical protein
MFRKRGRLINDKHWFYATEEVVVVNDFKYKCIQVSYKITLGILFQIHKYTNIVWKRIKDNKYTLISNLKRYNTKPKLALQLFDVFVSSIITYGCEIWVFTKSKQLETLHMKFCKTLLGVRLSSCNVAICRELGRYSLYINRCVHIVKYCTCN